MNDNLRDYKLMEHDKKIEEHDEILREHDEKLAIQDKSIITLASSIDKLTDKLTTGFAIGKWFIVLMLGQFVAFFFSMILKLF